ncbi:serine protease [Seongchinamella sediminis]|uniref:Serine protease n=1 Tax=Seongchinamella sediminis TaxID=2283635 RepID=A0A3L7E192_9GAMM|nr:trypsin-like peptidase domain-containing protein [Seongchinamella sediminis]RLQ22729.1 serine protease [Seongchinamella sediminis]
MPPVEPVLLTCAYISTLKADTVLTSASGFFFQRGKRLFLITNRHVLLDEASGHQPDRILIRMFTDEENLAATTEFSIPLYRDGQAQWLQAQDAGGTIDVVAIELQQEALPKSMVYEAFSPESLVSPETVVEVGTSLMVLGFPLGFSDTLHHLPVVRQAGLASQFGLRFEGTGFFLTDARTHRGISGGPVVLRVAEGIRSRPEFHWRLLGIHSSRLDVGSRDLAQDEALGLNTAWYPDVLLALTE